MFFGLLREWIYSPIENDRLLKNFIKQDFLSQFSGSIGGILWVFATPIITILIYSFVFGYVFQLRALPEFGETEFVIFMMIGYLPWIAFAEAIGKSPNLLLEKAPLITKVMFPVQLLPIVGTVIPYLTHVIGFGLLLIYLAIQGYVSILWLLLPIIFFLQFLFTMGIVALLSAFCVFLRDLQQVVALLVMIWFFLTPIIYPISLIESEAVRNLFLLNPMHSFVSLYRDILLLESFSVVNLQIIIPVSLSSYVLGGWIFMRIKHAFGDVL